MEIYNHVFSPFVHSIGWFLVLITLMHSGYFDSFEENHK